MGPFPLCDGTGAARVYTRSMAHKGVKLTQHQKDRISAKLKGRPKPESVKRKISATLSCTIRPPDVIRKISATAKRNWAKRKEKLKQQP